MMTMMRCKKIVPWLGILVVQLVCGLNIKFITYNMDSKKAFPKTMTDIIKEETRETVQNNRGETVQNNPPDIYVVSTQENNVYNRWRKNPIVASFEGSGYKKISMEASAYGSTRQFWLYIFQRSNNCAYNVKVTDTKKVVTQKKGIPGHEMITTKGALLAKVRVKDRTGMLVTEFVASSIHLNCTGADATHTDLRKAKAASKEAVADQKKAWTQILDFTQSFAGDLPVFLSGDLNPRTMRIGRDIVTDEDVYNGLNDGTLIFRAKHVKSAKSNQDGVSNPLYELGKLGRFLTGSGNNSPSLRENMLRGDTLRYFRHWITKEYSDWVWEEEPIKFYPTYKRKAKKGVKHTYHTSKDSVPAFTDRHILLRPKESYYKTMTKDCWTLSSYDSLESVTGSDHLPVVLTVEYSGSCVEDEYYI